MVNHEHAVLTFSCHYFGVNTGTFTVLRFGRSRRPGFQQQEAAVAVKQAAISRL